MAQLMLVNPRKRRTTRRRRPAARRTTSVTKSVTRRYRRNPIRRNDIAATFKKGAVGGMGALAVDVVMQKLPMIPANLRTGIPGALTKGMVGVGVGMLVGNLMKNKRLGGELADGAVTVALYNAGKSAIGPQLGLSGYDDLLGYSGDDGLLGMGYYDDNLDLSGGDMDDGMGYYDAAQTYDPMDEF